MAGYAREIEQYRPQLLTMEEAIPPDVTQLRSDGALAGLPYTVQVRRYDPWAFFIASKYPLTGRQRRSPLRPAPHREDDRAAAVGPPAAVGGPHHRSGAAVLHAPGRASWPRSTASSALRGPAGLLLVGDFNATWNNQGFRQILDAGMTDGAAARARPFEMTWSQIKPFLPPVVRIDHVLTGPGVAVTAVSTDEGPGATTGTCRPPWPSGGRAVQADGAGPESRVSQRSKVIEVGATMRPGQGGRRSRRRADGGRRRVAGRGDRGRGRGGHGVRRIELVLVDHRHGAIDHDVEHGHRLDAWPPRWPPCPAAGAPR